MRGSRSALLDQLVALIERIRPFVIADGDSIAGHALSIPTMEKISRWLHCELRRRIRREIQHDLMCRAGGSHCDGSAKTPEDRSMKMSAEDQFNVRMPPYDRLQRIGGSQAN